MQLYTLWKFEVSPLRAKRLSKRLSTAAAEACERWQDYKSLPLYL